MSTVEDKLFENVSSANTTALSDPAGLAGQIFAYGLLISMAIIPVYIGSFRSVSFLKKQKKSGEKPDVITTKDAAIFPLLASATLISAYLIFFLVSKEYTNTLMSFYFFIISILAVFKCFRPLFNKFIPNNLKFTKDMVYMFSLRRRVTKADDDSNEEDVPLLEFDFNFKDIIGFSICFLFSVWYFCCKHWVANNLIGFSISVGAIEVLQLNNFKNGLILLFGLFFYDIFWVFGTNIMVSVATNFEGPIKLMFPQDIFINGCKANKFAMLGLGDIVVPGIFIALLLRFDVEKGKHGKYKYFNCTYYAYLAALLLTIVVVHIFNHAQPALLYITPMCTIPPMLIAAVSGDLTNLFDYLDHKEEAVIESEKNK